jgi:hypothetical protein
MPHCLPRVACSQLLRPPDQPEQASLPITDALTHACPTMHALWQTDLGGVVSPEKIPG